jgi:hypothetical protein
VGEHKINGRWYRYQRPLRLMVEVLGSKAILSLIWRQVPQLGPKASLVPLMHFRFSARRCKSEDKPHLALVFRCRRFDPHFPFLRKACLADLAIWQLAVPLCHSVSVPALHRGGVAR